MNSCAFGPCARSKERGGKGCRMCDVVATGRVTYHTQGPCKRARKLGGEGCQCDSGKGHTIVAAQRGQRQLENVTSRDKKLTEKQKENQQKAAGKT